jgi:undecaprenyl diphosphate synthase
VTISTVELTLGATRGASLEVLTGNVPDRSQMQVEASAVDLFVRSSGEQRFSNFMLWQSAYAETVFLDTLFPDFDRRQPVARVRDLRRPGPPPRRRGAEPDTSRPAYRVRG